MRYLLVAVMLLSAAVVTGCDYRPYTYDALGKIVWDDGKPAVGVSVLLDTPEPTLPPPRSSADFASRHFPIEYVRDYSAITDNHGIFKCNCIAGQMYSGFAFSAPPAPPLDTVYLWVKPDSEWLLKFIRLNSESQMVSHPGGRHINLPTVVLPRPTTLQSNK